MKKNTLHLCNFNETNNLEVYQNLISLEDSIVFYSMNMTKHQSDELLMIFKMVKVYFVIENNVSNIATIGHEKWLELVNQFDKSLTWK